MAVKRGLGSGLEMLIPTGETTESTKTTKKTSQKKTKSTTTKTSTKSNTKQEQVEDTTLPKTLNILELEPNPNQPRTHFNDDRLHELSESIKEYGLIQPITVAKKENYYLIVAGERRWRAARMAGLTEVPVVILENCSDQTIMELSLIENIQREDLNPIEEALSYQRLIEECNFTQDQLADRVSKNRTTITNALRLLKLSKDVQQMLIDEKLTTGHARALIPITDEAKQYEIAYQVFDQSLNVRQTESLVKKVLEGNTITPSSSTTIDHPYLYEEAEKNLKDILGCKVSVKPKNNQKGKIELEYFSQEELENLLHRLNNIQK